MKSIFYTVQHFVQRTVYEKNEEKICHFSYKYNNGSIKTKINLFDRFFLV